MQNLFKSIFLYIISLFMLISLCGCAAADNTDAANVTSYDEVPVYLDESAPVIEFTPLKTSEDGLPEYYLFDDNPEHLNSKFLADGEEPGSIAHFEDLTPGIYTVFSYHHRGYSVEFDADLYYDAVFSTSDSGEFEILNLGLNHDWDWNQAWADYTETAVIMPEYLRTFNCTCGEDCDCDNCENPDCPAVIRGQSRTPNTEEYDNLGVSKSIIKGEPVYLSEFVSYISDSGLNHFRYGDWNEPMWMMMRFKVTSGTVTFDTIAYQDKSAAKKNFNSLKKGPFDNESQYKGIAQNAPIVTAAFDFEINDSTPNGAVPVTVKNARVPDGATIADGVFATNVNTWREQYPIAAESDLMLLEYKDDTKLSLYGEGVTERDNIWRFDPYHTKYYGGYDSDTEQALAEYGASVGADFSPNISILDIDYPVGSEICSDEFYSYNACNLGNFGVTSRYEIHLNNTGTENRSLSFTFSSIAGQVYRYSQTDSATGETVKDDGGVYIMKKFDDDPKEDPNSTTEPKERVRAKEYGDTLTFETVPGGEYDIVIEITTLTGCIAPMHNYMTVSE